MLKDIKDNGRTPKLISVKSRDSNINLHLLIIKLRGTKKSVLEKIMDLMKHLIF